MISCRGQSAPRPVRRCGAEVRRRPVFAPAGNTPPAAAPPSRPTDASHRRLCQLRIASTTARLVSPCAVPMRCSLHVSTIARDVDGKRRTRSGQNQGKSGICADARFTDLRFSPSAIVSGSLVAAPRAYDTIGSESAEPRGESRASLWRRHHPLDAVPRRRGDRAIAARGMPACLERVRILASGTAARTVMRWGATA